MEKRKNIIYTKIMSIIKPWIRSIAFHADIKLNYPYTGLGQHSLVFKDEESVYVNNIPKSAIFNTRSGKIVIGHNTVFGEDVMVLTGKHNFISEISTDNELHAVPEDGRSITIGDNCYIGSGAIIIGPVTIGDFAVVGAGAVVTKNVSERTMVGGVPAKKIKDLIQKYD